MGVPKVRRRWVSGCFFLEGAGGCFEGVSGCAVPKSLDALTDAVADVPGNIIVPTPPGVCVGCFGVCAWLGCVWLRCVLEGV